jgi:hypothetical protein
MVNYAEQNISGRQDRKGGIATVTPVSITFNPFPHTVLTTHLVLL